MTDNNAQMAHKLRTAMHLRAYRAFSFYILQTLWLLLVAFALLTLTNKFLIAENFFPASYDVTEIESGALLDTLWGTIGNLRCGATAMVIGTVIGAISGTVDESQTTKHAEAEKQYADTCKNNILLLIQIMKIQALIIIGSVILGPLLWLIAAKYNTRFFIIYEQVWWLYFLYLTMIYVPQSLTLPVILPYILRIMWRLQRLLGIVWADRLNGTPHEKNAILNKINIHIQEIKKF